MYYVKRHKPNIRKVFVVGDNGKLTAAHRALPVPGSKRKKQNRDLPPSNPFLSRKLQSEIQSITEERGEENTYKHAKQQRLKNWNNLRERLFSIGVDMNVPSSNECGQCLQKSENIIRCLDCGPFSSFCEECVMTVHKPPSLHVFEVWKNGLFIPYEANGVKWKRNDGHDCGSCFTNSVVVVDSKGRQHRISMECCSCEPPAATLVRFGLWPCSPNNTQLAIHQDLLDLLLALQLECNLSTKSFYDALKYRLPKKTQMYYNKEVKGVYNALIKETLAEYKLYKQKRNYLQGVDNGANCPACYKTPYKILSVDADFQLVRKASAGNHASAPRHEDIFFLQQDEVDNYMQSYDDTKKKSESLKRKEMAIRAGPQLLLNVIFIISHVKTPSANKRWRSFIDIRKSLI